MSRATIILAYQADRDRAIRLVRTVPVNTRVEFKESKRTIPQNDKLWATLTDVSRKATYHGRKMTPDDWKLVFMSGLEREMDLVPTIDGKGFVNLSGRSSKLTKKECADLIEIIHAYCAREGIELKQRNQAA